MAAEISDVLRPRTFSVKPTSTQRPRRRTWSQLPPHTLQDIEQVFSSFPSSQRAYTLLHKTKQMFDIAHACTIDASHFHHACMLICCWFPRVYPNESITEMHITIFAAAASSTVVLVTYPGPRNCNNSWLLWHSVSQNNTTVTSTVWHHRHLL